MRRILYFLRRRLAIDRRSGGGIQWRPVEPPDLGDVPAESLIEICEEFWRTWDEPWRPEIRDPAERTLAAFSDEEMRRRARFDAAVRELAERGPDVRDWARRTLQHPYYEARATAAKLLGRLGVRGLLGDAVGEVIVELGLLANRPRGEETKEVQANSAAVAALGAIGDLRGVAALREVLVSGRWLDDDLSWDAAEELGRLVGRDFLSESEPVQAALAWLRTNSDPAGPVI